MLKLKEEMLQANLQQFASQTPESCIGRLGSTFNGLSPAEVRERLSVFGINEIQEQKQESLLFRLVRNFTHLMAILLWVGGGIAFLAQLPQLGIAIWMVNIINGLFSFWQEFRAEKATEALKKMLPVYSHVIRQGDEIRIPARELVPGDLILLNEGDRISADCRLIKENNLRIDQATLTGESHPIAKMIDVIDESISSNLDLPNIIYAGTCVFSGSGEAVVLFTGMETEFGKIAKMTQTISAELSPLQKEMQQVTKMVSLVAVLVGMLFFFFAFFLAHITLAESFIFTLGMIVAFVPEGLLPTVTLALAMGTQRMARRHALVKKLSSVESLGCTNVICTDKTGTLTENKMVVRNIWLPSPVTEYFNGEIGVEVTATGQGTNTDCRVQFASGKETPPYRSALKQLLLIASLCNNARNVFVVDADRTNPTRSILGDPTEVALQIVAEKAGIDTQKLHKEISRISEIPFDSYRKCMSTYHRIDNESYLFTKGAPKEILDRCSHIRIGNEVFPLTPALYASVLAANDHYSNKGQRILAYAYRAVEVSSTQMINDELETELIFVGLTAMIDPPRPEVAQAVAKCHSAGIRVIMITGDYGLTAKSIAAQIGLISSDKALVITGADLEAMTNEALKEALTHEVVFARSTPEQKLRIVAALQEMGNIVAVTGDGVNDAPALKKANISVAMGLNGSDVAKEAADLVLTDDNFATIVNAIEEGRTVYENIKKFTTYIFTSNTPEAVPFIFYAFSAARIPLALNVMHILSIDLGTDMVPALGLGAELPEQGIMQRAPRKLSDHIINKKMMVRAYLFLGLIQSAVAMLAFYYAYWTNGYWGQLIDLPDNGRVYQTAVSMALAAVVMTQIGNVLTQRSENSSIFSIRFFSNPFIFIGILSEVLILLAILYVPALQAFIGTTGLNGNEWLFLICISPSLLIIDEFRKFLRSRKGSKYLSNL